MFFGVSVKLRGMRSVVLALLCGGISWAIALNAPYAGWHVLGSQPLSVKAGNSAAHPSLALDARGRPVVAWLEDSVLDNIYVRRWNGNTWTLLGKTGVNRAADTDLWEPAMVLDHQGFPTVAWTGHNRLFPKAPIQLYVSRWNGRVWKPLGRALPQGSGDGVPSEPRLAVDREGVVTLAWIEDTKDRGSIHVARWKNATWNMIGSGRLDMTTSGLVLSPALALDRAGLPSVAWLENNGKLDYLTNEDHLYVKHWDGKRWSLVGPTSIDINGHNEHSAPSLQIDSLNRPVVAWTEYGYTPSAVYVKRWDGQRWNLIGNTPATSDRGTYFWESPSLALNSADNPVVSWVEEGKKLYVKRWSGAAWVYLDTARLNASLAEIGRDSGPNDPTLALGSDGQPFLAWSQVLTNNDFYGIHVRRYVPPPRLPPRR